MRQLLCAGAARFGHDVPDNGVATTKFLLCSRLMGRGSEGTPSAFMLLHGEELGEVHTCILSCIPVYVRVILSSCRCTASES